MFDAVTAKNIPATAKMVAGYVDGKFKWSAADWLRFPHAIKVRIACFAHTNDGVVLDVEDGNATPAQAPAWVVMRRVAGVDPTVYCSYGDLGHTWALVINEFHRQKVHEPHYWIAAYPGNGAQLYPGTVAHQYANNSKFDTSVVDDYWSGVDPKPVPKPVPVPIPPVPYVPPVPVRLPDVGDGRGRNEY